MAGYDERRGKQAGGCATFLNGRCVFLIGREQRGGRDGGDPHGDGEGRVEGDSCGPSTTGCRVGEDGSWAPFLAR